MAKEPKRIKLTDSPESKKVKLIPLKSNENYSENNKKSIQQLESYETD